MGDRDGQGIFFLDEGDPEAQARALLEKHGVPFEPRLQSGVQKRASDGRQWVYFRYGCTALQADGRCGIYADRPHPCRAYEPGSDGMCVFTRRGTLRKKPERSPAELERLYARRMADEKRRQAAREKT